MFIADLVTVLLDSDWVARHMLLAIVKKHRPWAAARAESILSPDVLLTGTNTSCFPLECWPVALRDRRKRQTTLDEFFVKRARLAQ
jgi:hypothetical protein